MTERFHVITGGPGSGKSSLIAALAAEGFHHMPEAGRAVIQDQVAIGGNALPWSDRVRFAEWMLAWEMRSFREAIARQGAVIFDPGISDVVGYLRLSGLPVPTATMQAARIWRYAKRVFIAPHWPAISAQDAERKQTPAKAAATYHAMVGVYTRFGYELIPLPVAPIAERVGFVRSYIA
jgi:predicted ATPase